MSLTKDLHVEPIIYTRGPFEMTDNKKQSRRADERVA